MSDLLVRVMCVLSAANLGGYLKRPAGDGISDPMLSKDSSAAQSVIRVMGQEVPDFGAANLDTPFELLNIDSFAALTMRVELERIGLTFPDEIWTTARTPSDLIRFASSARFDAAAQHPRPPDLRRRYVVAMPMMALGGLSESWLFKELGDIHWAGVMNGLGARSSTLADGSGNRLYATFTVIRLECSTTLAQYAEDASLEIQAGFTRYGAGMFFSDASVRSGERSAHARLMSSFSKRGESGSNLSLLKGQPDISDDCPVPALEKPPDCVRDHRARRASIPANVLFECEYEIIPAHDINGVGLLYFASYPIISDICTSHFAGRDFSRIFSTRRREVFYFANSDADDTLIFRLHKWNEEDNSIEIESSLARKSDGTTIASILVQKERVLV